MPRPWPLTFDLERPLVKSVHHARFFGKVWLLSAQPCLRCNHLNIDYCQKTWLITYNEYREMAVFTPMWRYQWRYSRVIYRFIHSLGRKIRIRTQILAEMKIDENNFHVPFSCEWQLFHYKLDWKFMSPRRCAISWATSWSFKFWHSLKTDWVTAISDFDLFFDLVT